MLILDLQFYYSYVESIQNDFHTSTPEDWEIPTNVLFLNHLLTFAYFVCLCLISIARTETASYTFPRFGYNTKHITLDTKATFNYALRFVWFGSCTKTCFKKGIVGTPVHMPKRHYLSDYYCSEDTSWPRQLIKEII